MTIYLGDQEKLFNNILPKSIDAIITDPPYGLKWNHRIETGFNFDNFLENAYRVLKDNGFLVYFGQEPSISQWNTLTQQKFNYLAEVIWYKKGPSSPYIFPLRVHEKIMIFTKGKGKLNKATIEWEDEKEELLEYVSKKTILRTMADIKSLIRNKATVEEIQEVANGAVYTKTDQSSKVNDNIYKIGKYSTNRQSYILNPKKLTTLWGCRSHNQQGYNNPEFNIKHPTVKPIHILERLLEMTTQKGQIVLDPFMGSGTTGIACKALKRNFIGFELMEDYYKIAENRLNKVA
ncbi:Site-specific DNA-methyltransferase [Candidatus Hepatincolaceae symbiont of Richtersius coronifer]